MQRLKRTAVRVEIFFYSLLWLMVLLLIGTIAQRYVGLYTAQKLYFSSFIAWIGPVPVPGGYLVMSIIFINLLAKFLFASKWHISRAGTLIVHMGAILLLFGGFLTAAFSYEGSMVIPEGQSRDYVSDYHQREFAIIDSSDELVFSMPFEKLRAGTLIEDWALPFSVSVLKACRNCALLMDEDKNMIMRPIALEKEDEVNQSGVEFNVSGISDSEAGKRHIISEAFPMPTIIKSGETTYRIGLRKTRSSLPFKIELINFEKTVHPGTNTAKSYSSEIRVIDGDLEWRSVISMNEPLRYKGYTFYQSSFLSDGETEATVLAVVKNIGRMFPYISSIVMCIGLLIHLVIQMPKLMRKS